MKQKILILPLLILIFLAVNCSGTDEEREETANTSNSSGVVENSFETPASDTTTVEEAVAYIHELYNKRNLEALYDMATNGMKQQIEKDQFVQFLTRLRSTLGTVNSSQVTNRTGEEGDELVAVTMDVKYENDSGTEQWTLNLSGERIQWSEFNYDAPSLYEN